MADFAKRDLRIERDSQLSLPEFALILNGRHATGDKFCWVRWHTCGFESQVSLTRIFTGPRKPGRPTRIRSFAPQLLVDDLGRAIKFYSEVLGFSFGPTWHGFYAVGERDGFEVHLKCAPKAVGDRANRRQHEHLDVYASVTGVDALYAGCKAKGAIILKP
jgi:predicted enzyme related to lactoylglutathione lyase